MVLGLLRCTLTSRADPLTSGGLTETFQYDNLNRLTQSALTQGGIAQTPVALTYDAIGNITSKTGVGKYAYHATKIHAVVQAGNNAYEYDANGNLVGGAGRAVSWTSWNMPASDSYAGATTSWTYDAEHVRIKQITGAKTTYYLNPRADLGGHYEEEHYAGGRVDKLHGLYAAGQYIGQITTTNQVDVATKTRYFHTDHLGSISVVTNESGAVVARYTYDAWGKRQIVTGEGEDLHHGYTGHEHLDDGFIHMNGRLYDPVLGRFISADPYIQDPSDGQGFNRYSYVNNNPLSLTDPSGYLRWKSIRNVVVRVVAAILDVYGCSGYCSAAVGAYQGYKQGGTPGAVVGGVMGYVGYQMSVNYPLVDSGGVINWGNVARTAAVNAVGGCASAAAGGGNCGRGAAAGAISTVGAPYGLRGTIIAGCAAGKISGGSCGEGAFNAVASYAAYSAIRYAIDAQRVETPVVRLRVKFSSLDAEMFDSPEEGYRYHEGRPELVRAEIDTFIHTRRGANIFSQDGVLTIYPEQGANGPSARIDGMSINYNGGRVNGFAHEIGHTVWGGSYCDYAGQAAGCGSTYRVGNVQVNENAFRKATWQLPRFWYRETNPNHQYYGKSFYVGPQ